MTKEDKGKSPKAKKTKEPKAKEVDEVETVPYEVRMKAVTVISKPMADEKKVRVLRTGSGCYRMSLFALSVHASSTGRPEHQAEKEHHSSSRYMGSSTS